MIATTIKTEHLKAIQAGTKKIEYRACSDYWAKRIEGKRHGAIIFISGAVYAAFYITKIKRIRTPEGLSDIIPTPLCYAIHLGGGLTLTEAREAAVDGE